MDKHKPWFIFLLNYLNPTVHCQKKRYKSCHWGGTFSKRYAFVPKRCILVP